MVRLRETLRAAAVLEEAPPDRVLVRVNAAAAIAPETLAGALFGVLDPGARTFTYASAGHPAPMIVRDGCAMALPSGGALLGVDAGMTYERRTERSSPVTASSCSPTI
jgi:serine phosphatase RsbU (regulator of sigma subunit)